MILVPIAARINSNKYSIQNSSPKFKQSIPFYHYQRPPPLHSGGHAAAMAYSVLFSGLRSLVAWSCFVHFHVLCSSWSGAWIAVLSRSATSATRSTAAYSGCCWCWCYGCGKGQRPSASFSRAQVFFLLVVLLVLGPKSFTSLKANLWQNINGGFVGGSVQVLVSSLRREFLSLCYSSHLMNVLRKTFIQWNVLLGQQLKSKWRKLSKNCHYRS